jgi:putative tricarboxylic transport membrane protein
LIKIWVKILQIPRPVLYSGILVFATLGVYAATSSLFYVFVAYGIGIVGFFMRLYDFPISPVILGVILGEMIDVQFRRTLVISNGDFSVFVSRPLTAVLLSLAVVALLLPYLPRIVARLRGRTASRLAFGEDD